MDAFNDDVIKMASTQLVAGHAANFMEEKILRQRHQVNITGTNSKYHETTELKI